METIYLKIKINKTDEFVEQLRNEGLFFETIADSLNLSRNAIVEIDEKNYKQNIHQLKKIFSKSCRIRNKRKMYKK